jgi:hypothetical protein
LQLDYKLDDRKLDLIPGRSKIFFSYPQTGFGDHPASSPMDIKGSFLGGKATRA